MLFYSDKKLSYQDPVEFLQHAGDGVLEVLTSIVAEHLLEVKCYSFLEGIPSLGGILGCMTP